MHSTNHQTGCYSTYGVTNVVFWCPLCNHQSMTYFHKCPACNAPTISNAELKTKKSLFKRLFRGKP